MRDAPRNGRGRAVLQDGPPSALSPSGLRGRKKLHFTLNVIALDLEALDVAVFAMDAVMR